jgi:hypothetical protein
VNTAAFSPDGSPIVWGSCHARHPDAERPPAWGPVATASRRRRRRVLTRGADPRREGPREIILTEIGGADPSSGVAQEASSPQGPPRARCPRRCARDDAATGQFVPSGKEWLRPQAPYHVKRPLILPPSKSSSPGSGAAAGGVSTTAPGAGARSAWACRSIFWKAKTSPGKITTASVHVAPVQRNLPPPMPRP